MILLDTHVLLWLDQGRTELGRSARRRTDEALGRGELAVSAISFWEIARLAQRERVLLRLPADTWRRDLLGSGLHEVPIDGRIGIRAAELEQLHRDPADRLIVATAIELGARLMTADHRILAWAGNLLRLDAGNDGFAVTRLKAAIAPASGRTARRAGRTAASPHRCRSGRAGHRTAL